MQAGRPPTLGADVGLDGLEELGHARESQLLVSVALPAHFLPPFEGLGLLHTRLRDCCPPPHVLEQGLKVVQSLHEPSTLLAAGLLWLVAVAPLDVQVPHISAQFLRTHPCPQYELLYGSYLLQPLTSGLEHAGKPDLTGEAVLTGTFGVALTAVDDEEQTPHISGQFLLIHPPLLQYVDARLA